MAGKGKVRTARAAWVIVAIDVCWLAVLIVLLYWHDKDEALFAPHLVAVTDPLGGLLPLIVPWAGALGGVTISLMGAAKHAGSWDHRMNIWHGVRPLLGAVAGTIAFIIVVIVLRLYTGVEPGNEGSGGGVSPPQSALGLAFIIGFVAGFRDKFFLELILKVAKVIFSNGDDQSKAKGYSFSIDEWDFGDVQEKVGRGVVAIRVTFEGSAPELLANWATTNIPAFTVVPQAAVPNALYRDLEVSFTPDDARPYEDRLTAVISGASKTVALKGRGIK